MYVTTDQGQKITMPRYYKEKIYSEEKRKIIGAKARLKAIEMVDKYLDENPQYFRDKAESDKHKFYIQSLKRTDQKL